MRPLFLVVDDDKSQRELVGQALVETAGGEARYAAGHDDAVASIAGEPPDLITTDIIHVGERGDALFRQVREDPQTEHIPFVVISGCLNDESELELYRMGVEAVLRKPFSINELVSRVRRLLRR
jgi:DNA-binding response OmpR family regulator